MRTLRLLGVVVGSLVCVAPMLAQKLTLDPQLAQDSRTNPPVLTFVPKADSFALPGLQTKPEWTPRPLGTTFALADSRLGSIVVPLKLAENTGTCYAIRGYKFSEETERSGVTKSEGMTTCQPSRSVHMKTIVVPR